MYQPLAGYKIIDCSRLLPYQYCTLLLGDLGAEILKLEEPGKGDYGRWTDLNTPGKESLTFVMANRNKKSMTLNLKEEPAKAIFKKLIKSYDVIFETFRPGTMDRLGLGYQNIKDINPRIIYCSGTGYGQNGPYRLKAGHDINYISIAGILGATGMHTGHPIIPAIPFADMAGGGLFPAFVIIAALLGRERTGKGQYIDVAMTDVVTSLNISNIATAIAKKAGEEGRPFSLLGKSICYNSFKTKDEKFISIGNLESKFWENFCRAVKREDLIEKHHSFFLDGDEFTESLKLLFASKTQSEWVEFMEKIDTCFTPVNAPEDVLNDRQLIERGMITRMRDPKRGETVQLGFPTLFSDNLHFKRAPAPLLGEHTIEILKSLNYTLDQIENLKQIGAI